MQPAALEKAIASGRAPVLRRIAERGTRTQAAAMFPSVTPVCATAIATGVRQDEHGIPAMCWYDREEGRYVDYGASFNSSRRFGFARQLKDLIYAMNDQHLTSETIFEQLDDAGLRTAGTTFLIRRGRHEHRPAKGSALSRLASTVIRKPVMGPKELFYADLFESRETGCTGALGLPGNRDQHTGCVGAYLLERDLCDFLLFSLPDNDTHSHRNGPEAQVGSIAEADRQLERLAHAAGGVETFLDTWAVIVVADHSHTEIKHRIELEAAIGERFTVLQPSGRRSAEAEVAFCPSQRSAQIYALGEEAAARRLVLPRLVETALGVEGVELACFRSADGDAVIERAGGGTLSFAPGTSVEDPRGGRWRVHGDLEVLGARIDGDAFTSPDFPDALARVWGSLRCRTTGDVVLSAAPGWEVPDWGGVDHIGGGSHGSLHADDSLGALLFCGLEAPAERRADGQWSIRDVAPMAFAHLTGAG